MAVFPFLWVTFLFGLQPVHMVVAGKYMGIIISWFPTFAWAFFACSPSHPAPVTSLPSSSDHLLKDRFHFTSILSTLRSPRAVPLITYCVLFQSRLHTLPLVLLLHGYPYLLGFVHVHYVHVTIVSILYLYPVLFLFSFSRMKHSGYLVGRGSKTKRTFLEPVLYRTF